MRRVSRLSVVLLLLFAVAPLFSQATGEPGAKTETSRHLGEGTGLTLWAWINFAILVGGLGYLVSRHGTPYFAARSKRIRKEMFEAEELRAEAEARMAEVDARLSNLQVEIEALRREALAEKEAEGERMRKETAAEIAKIRDHAEQEIVSAGRSARMELRHYSAEIALQLAQERLRDRLTPKDQEALVQGFVTHLNHPASRAESN